MNLKKLHRQRMLNAISGYDARIVRECLEMGDCPHGCTRIEKLGPGSDPVHNPR